MLPPQRWNQLVEDVFGRGTRIDHLRFFESKKNQVTLLTLQLESRSVEVVAKYFVWGECEREWDVLKRADAAGLAVPRPLARRDNVCFLEYVAGRSLKALGELEPERLDGAAVGQWLGRFHRVFHTAETAVLKGDCAPPNFIAGCDGILYGIDFEESREGDLLEEVAEAAVSLLMFRLPAGPRTAFSRPNVPAARALIRSWCQEQPPSPLAGKERVEELARTLAPRMASNLTTRARYAPGRTDEFHDWARMLSAQPELLL